MTDAVPTGVTPASPASALPPLRLLIAAPRGFCAGVDRAIEIVERSIRKFGAPVYVRHEIVHNRFVVDGLRDKGAVFVEDLVRNVAVRCEADPNIVWFRVEAENFESIHNHNAYALIEKPAVGIYGELNNL